MLRQPAVAGKFYPSNAQELSALVRRYSASVPEKKKRVRACLVPHAGYMYSGHVAGAVYARMALPKRIVILGVRHYPHGERAAILSAGAWRTPLGDAEIDEELAQQLKRSCPLLREDSLAHSAEHSLEVQLPFLQVLAPGFRFAPLALGTVHMEHLREIGEEIAGVLNKCAEEVLLLTTSDLNHYENDATTRRKDHQAVEKLMALDAEGLMQVCTDHKISMCGLGPAVAMMTALRAMGATRAELVKYATSADVSGDTSAVVGYAGIIFP